MFQTTNQMHSISGLVFLWFRSLLHVGAMVVGSQLLLHHLGPLGHPTDRSICRNCSGFINLGTRTKGPRDLKVRCPYGCVVWLVVWWRKSPWTHWGSSSQRGNINIHIYIYIYIYIYICMNYKYNLYIITIYIHICIHVCIYINIYIYMHLVVYLYLQFYIYLSIYLSINLSIYLYIYILLVDR